MKFKIKKTIKVKYLKESESNLKIKKKGYRWYLDFAKEPISIEVAFNSQMREATAHNLIKPLLASQLNHVEKDIQTDYFCGWA